MICKKCHFQNEESAKFCRNCGSELHKYDGAKKNKSKTILSFSLSITIIGCLILGILYYNTLRDLKVEKSIYINTTQQNNRLLEVVERLEEELAKRPEIRTISSDKAYWYSLQDCSKTKNYSVKGEGVLFIAKSTLYKDFGVFVQKIQEGDRTTQIKVGFLKMSDVAIEIHI